MIVVVDDDVSGESKVEVVDKVVVEECKMLAPSRGPNLIKQSDLTANLPKLIRSTQLSTKYDRFELASQLLCVEMVNHVVDETTAPTLIESHHSPFIASQQSK